MHIRTQIIELLRGPYSGFGPTFTAEKLAEREKIVVDAETVRRIMLAEALPYKRRKHKQYRSMRPRKEQRGELIQFDGSDHDWLEGRGPKFTLLRFVDDATSELLHAKFVLSESNESVMTVTIEYLQMHGRPIAVYVDRGKVFRVNVNNDEGDRLTQYQRALGLLDIELKHAYSPQAKGRVERSFQTDQDRLVKEMRLAGINSMEEANQFLLQYYIPKFNKKFAKPAAKKSDLHRSIANFKLDDIFCIREERTVTNDWTIRYHKRIFQLSSKQPAIVRPKDRITIHRRLDGAIFMTIRKSTLKYTEITSISRPKIKKTRKPKITHRSHIPRKDHPWRTYRSACAT